MKLSTPGACSAVPPPPGELKIKDAQAYILANGVKADTDAMGDVLTDPPTKIRKIVVEPAVAIFNVAVTQDAKDANAADFTVNMKEPLSCKDAPGSGTELKIQPATELDGTYDTYTQIAAAGSMAAKAQIVLRDGFLQEEKKATPGAPHGSQSRPQRITRNKPLVEHFGWRWSPVEKMLLGTSRAVRKTGCPFLFRIFSIWGPA